jgi:hypothetical protein
MNVLVVSQTTKKMDSARTGKKSASAFAATLL